MQRIVRAFGYANLMVCAILLAGSLSTSFAVAGGASPLATDPTCTDCCGCSAAITTCAKAGGARGCNRFVCTCNCSNNGGATYLCNDA
jgi:hypothetical protein